MTHIDCEPLYLSGCFAWVHVPRTLHAGCRGVVLCAPLGDEALGTYRGWRGLADRLAGAGMPVLRFDYPASGDSLSNDGELPGLQPWLACIVEAARHLREHFGVAEIALCGLRMGATLATLAAAEAGATRLAVLSPFVTGRSYVRELRAGARMLAAIWQVPPAIEQSGWFEALGVRWDGRTKQEMEAIDLARLPLPPAPGVLVAAPGGALAPLHALADRWRGLGATVTVEAAGDLDGYLQESSAAVAPHATFARVVDWLAHDAPSLPGQQVLRPATAPAKATLSHATEQPIRFGPDDRGFGIWCKSLAPESPNAPTVVILNTTLNPRGGNSRMAVTLARALAAQGFNSLRIDTVGSGDSPPFPEKDGHPYSPENIQTAISAVNWVHGISNCPVVLFGLCSGAYTAFHLALVDSRIRTLVLVNMQKLIWSAGMSTKIIQQGTLRSSYYLERLLEGAAWRRLLQRDIAVRRIGGELARRTGRAVINTIQARTGLRMFDNTASRIVWRWFDDLHRRGVKLVMLLGSHDPARDEIDIYFGANGKRLQRYSTVDLKVFREIDHSLSTATMRQLVIDQVLAAARSLATPSLGEGRNGAGSAQA